MIRASGSLLLSVVSTDKNMFLPMHTHREYVSSRFQIDPTTGEIIKLEKKSSKNPDRYELSALYSFLIATRFEKKRI